MKKKVEGSSQVSQVETDGLKEHRKGTDQGSGKPKTLHGKISSMESRNFDCYPNKRQIKKQEYGDISIQVFGDNAAIKRYEDDSKP